MMESFTPGHAPTWFLWCRGAKLGLVSGFRYLMA
jgi:hypothetical protein